jgi:polar amino acid transport system substrate-binding protein
VSAACLNLVAPSGRPPPSRAWRRCALAAALAAGLAFPARAAPPAAASAPASAPAALGCSRPLTLGLHEHGLLYSSQTGEGIDKDIADEMARRTGCRLTLTVMQRARIWQLLETGALDFSLSAIADPQREKFASFAWYVSNKYYLLVRKDADVRTVNDFRRRHGLKLGVIRGFRYGPAANLMVDRLDDDQRVTYGSSLEPLYAILQENHIQAMIVEPFDYPAFEAAQWRSLTTILEFDDPAVPHGLVMSRHSLTDAQREAWADVIRSMRADGTMLRIFEKYFPPDLARAMTQF